MSAIPPIAATLPSAPPSPARELWRDFRRNRGAVIGLAVLALLVFCALFADVISPYNPSEQYRDATLRPPSLTPVGGHVFLLGTDPVGRDVLSRLIHGTRLSLVIGAVSVGLSLFASYIVALTVVPLFCAKFISGHEAPASADRIDGHAKRPGRFARLGTGFNRRFNAGFEAMLVRYDRTVRIVLDRPTASLVLLLAVCLVALAPGLLLPVSYFPRTDPGQFVINLKAPTGSRLGVTTTLVKQVEDEIRGIVSKHDLDIIVSNIGVAPGFSSIYSSNTGTHTAFVQVGLKPDHTIGSYAYMDRVRAALAKDMPQIRTYFQSGGLVDAVLNLGLPAPIDIQISNNDLDKANRTAVALAARIRQLPNVNDVFVHCPAYHATEPPGPDRLASLSMPV